MILIILLFNFKVCKPNIWYFEAMMFIVEHCTPRQTVDSISLPVSSPEFPGDTQFSISETEVEEVIDSIQDVTEFHVIETDFENQENSFEVTITQTLELLFYMTF